MTVVILPNQFIITPGRLFKEDLNIVLDLRSLNEGLVKIREYVWSTYVRELSLTIFIFGF